MFKKINQNNNITFIQKKIFCLIYANIYNKLIIMCQNRKFFNEVIFMILRYNIIDDIK
jgi:hypothetical protein